VQGAAPQARVLLVHAGAADLARLYERRALRPLLLAADQPESLTHAYASMKLLALRRALMSYDLLLAAPPQHRRVPAIARRLAGCAESFLGAALHDWVAIDPACDVREDPGEALCALVQAQLRLQGDVPLPPPSLHGAAAAPRAMNLN
jgi:flagellar biosynthesis protein FlhG